MLVEYEMVQLLWKSLVVCEKVEHRITISPSNSTPRYIPKELKTDMKTKT